MTGEIDPDRPWLARGAQQPGEKLGPVRDVGLNGADTTTSTYLDVEAQFKKMDGTEWYLPDRPDPPQRPLTRKQKRKKSRRKKEKVRDKI